MENNTKDDLIDCISCFICFEIIEDPRLLSCFHTFCFQCLKKLCKDDIILCPLCKEKTNIKDFNSLPKNYFVNDVINAIKTNEIIISKQKIKEEFICENCNDNQAFHYCKHCSGNWCEKCLKNYHSSKIFQNHILIPIEKKKSQKLYFCPKHLEEKLKSWCETCSSLCCNDCLLYDGHKDHNFMSIMDAMKISKKLFQSELEKLIPYENLLKESQVMIEESIQIQNNNFITIQKKIEDTFNNLINQLNQRKSQLITKIEKDQQQNLSNLENQKKNIFQQLDFFSIQKSLTKELIQNNDGIQVLKMKNELLNNFNNFFSNIKKNISPSATIKFTLDFQFPNIDELGIINKENQYSNNLIPNKNNSIYVIGGYNGNDGLNTVERYNPNSNQWEFITPMNEKRYYHGVVEVNNFIYVIGGYNGKNYLNTVERYNPSSNQWEFITPMNEKRYGSGVVEVNNFIYVIGGNNGNGALNTVERYNPNSNQWEFITPMNEKRYGSGVVEFNNFIYVIGGYNGNDALNTVERYNPNTNQWELITPMNEKRYYHGVVEFNNFIYVIGGHNGKNYLNTVERYNPNTNQWEFITSMNEKRYAPGIAVL